MGRQSRPRGCGPVSPIPPLRRQAVHTYVLTLAMWNDARANSSLWPGDSEEWLTILLVDRPEVIPSPGVLLFAAVGVGLVGRLHRGL